MNVECPNCCVSDWTVPASVEVTVRVLNGRAVAVTVTEPHTTQGEGDAVCSRCGQLLLNWRHPTKDDDEWKAHHDERRPAWDELVALVPTLTLPPTNQWGMA